MSKEIQHLPFEEIKEGTEDSHVIHRRLTPEALQQIRLGLGKQVEVTFTNERWIYTGPDDEEDHGTSELVVSGTLANVNEKSLEIEVITGKTTYDNGAIAVLNELHIKLPFYQSHFALRRSAETSQILAVTIEDRTYLPATL